MHSEPSSFITLTFDEKYAQPSLEYRGEYGFQRFMYRVRRRLGPTRFFMCGEYGGQTLRPHYHAILFGRTFEGPPCGKDIRRSPVLEKLWPYGFSSVGDVTYQSAAYVASYVCQKVTGERAADHYCRVDWRTGEYVHVMPEFGRMSLNPGIGATWFAKYWREVFSVRDGVVMPGGRVVPPPRFYQNLLRLLPEDADGKYSERVEFDRYVRAQRFVEDCAPDRLLVRETCAVAKARFLRRTL